VESDSNIAAFAHARAAVASDPLAVEPRFLLASLYQSVDEAPAARAQLQQAVRSQPENPATWAQLGGMELRAGEPQQALAALQHVVALDHTSDPTTRAAALQIAQAQARIAQVRSAAVARRRSSVKSRRRSQSRGQSAK
jgi:Tfp pilus assembly protein PilF